MIVTFICASQPADQVRIQVRCRNMVDAINRTRVHRANLLDMKSFIQNTAHAQQVCREADLLVIYRYLYGPILEAIQYWKARDKKVVVDFDQAINFLPESNPASAFWLDGDPLASCDSARIDPPPIEQFKWGLGMVDAAITPSERLANDWSRFTSVYKVPDYINTYQYPASNHGTGKEIWIGLGNRAGYESFERSGLRAAMENVCRKRPQVQLFLYDMEEAVDALDINPKQLRVFSPCFFEEWVGILLGFNIGLMPMTGEYDARLGSYELLEFMISKIPWIASEEAAFSKLSQYGRCTKNTEAAWEASILDMVDHIDIHESRAAGEPFLFALNQDLSANIDKVLRVYATIINQRTGAG